MILPCSLSLIELTLAHHAVHQGIDVGFIYRRGNTAVIRLAEPRGVIGKRQGDLTDFGSGCRQIGDFHAAYPDREQDWRDKGELEHGDTAPVIKQVRNKAGLAAVTSSICVMSHHPHVPVSVPYPCCSEKGWFLRIALAVKTCVFDPGMSGTLNRRS